MAARTSGGSVGEPSRCLVVTYSACAMRAIATRCPMIVCGPDSRATLRRPSRCTARMSRQAAACRPSPACNRARASTNRDSDRRCRSGSSVISKSIAGLPSSSDELGSQNRGRSAASTRRSIAASCRMSQAAMSGCSAVVQGCESVFSKTSSETLPAGSWVGSTSGSAGGVSGMPSALQTAGRSVASIPSGHIT